MRPFFSLTCLLLVILSNPSLSLAFAPSRFEQSQAILQNHAVTSRFSFSSALRFSSPSSSSGYIPPNGDNGTKASTTDKKTPLYPKAGDFVRYYDLDGGRPDGQMLVGRIRFIQKQMDGSGWTLELSPMEDVGGGYYTDYGSRKRFLQGSTYRNLKDVSPLTASFVRSEDAYKIPTRTSDGALLVKAEQYDIEGYTGPFQSIQINSTVVEVDALLYQALKGKLFRYVAIAGAIGTLVCDLTRGTEQAVIYFAGFVSSLLYLFLLSLKTDTIGTTRTQFGNSLSALRFVMPILVLIGVAFYNANEAQMNPLADSGNLFSTVTPNQFAAAIVGFLTYRLPLLLIQLEDAFKEEESGIMPGSVGMAVQMLKQDENQARDVSLTSDATKNAVFLISGPQATGRSELVRRLLDSTTGNDSDIRFTTPVMVDAVKNGATFERCLERNEFLSVDPTNRFGLTQQAIFDAAQSSTKDSESRPIVVVDADVELAKKLSKVPNLRLVCVWVGLGSVAEFETRLGSMIDSGELTVDEGETRESIIRSKIREIVKEIEYGISSGIFEFTILNDGDPDDNLRQLREAAKYVNM